MDNKKENKVDKIEEKEERKAERDKLQYKQLILIILITVIMILVSLGLSFSIIRLLSSGKNMNFNTIMIPITPVPGDPGHVDKEDFIFSYKEKETIGNGIYIENMFPTTDAVGKNLIGEYNTFEFSLYFGNKSKNRYYEITAEMMNDCTLSGDHVKIYLESDDVPLENTLRPNGKVKVFSDYENATANKNNNREKIIHSGKISKEEVKRGQKDFILRMWFSEDAPLNNQTLNKKFSIKINVYAK